MEVLGPQGFGLIVRAQICDMWVRHMSQLTGLNNAATKAWLSGEGWKGGFVIYRVPNCSPLALGDFSVFQKERKRWRSL